MDKNKQKTEKIKADIATLQKNKDKLRWLFAVIFILISFPTFQYSIIGGLLYILLGLFLVPQISVVLSNHDKLKISQNNIVWYSIVLFLLIGAGQLAQLGEIENKKSDYLKNKTSILADIEKDIDNNSFSDASSKVKKHLDLLPQDEELKNLKIAIEDKKEKLEEKRESQAKNQQANNKATFNLTADEYLMLGKCMGYIQYQVNRKIDVHESHVKFYNKYIEHVGPLMKIAGQYPSCSKPGMNIKDCLSNNGVNDEIINLAIGVNTGGEAHKDPTTKALMSAACMEL